MAGVGGTRTRAKKAWKRWDRWTLKGHPDQRATAGQLRAYSRLVRQSRVEQRWRRNAAV